MKARNLEEAISNLKNVADQLEECEDYSLMMQVCNSIDFLEELKESWHTGMPTEEGWYLIKLRNDSNWYRPNYYVVDYCSNPTGENGKMMWSNDDDWKEYPMVGWRPVELVEPYVS